MTDKAIEFETELYKVKRVIRNLNDIGFDTKIYEDIVEKVVEMKN